MRAAVGVLVMVLGLAASGCGQMVQSLAPQYRTTQANSHVHAFQTASFSFTSGDLEAVQWDATLKKVEADALPMLEALRQGGHRMSIEVTPHQSGDIEHYEVRLAFEPKQPGEPLPVLTAKAGMEPAAYDESLQPASQKLGIDAHLLQRGHLALAAMVNMMTATNVSNHIAESRAFALLVLKEKIKRGEKADYFDPNRPAQESIEDIDVALRVVAEEHARIARMRAEVLTLMALAARYEQPEAIDVFRQQVRESREKAVQWRASHPRPTMQDFGVRVAQLPTPDKMLEELKERAGFVTAVVQVAQGVATGSPSATLEGLSRLAPKDSTAAVALTGLAAAASGDAKGTVEAMIKLSGKEAQIDELRGRVEQVAGVMRAVDRRI